MVGKVHAPPRSALAPDDRQRGRYVEHTDLKIEIAREVGQVAAGKHFAEPRAKHPMLTQQPRGLADHENGNLAGNLNRGNEIEFARR